MSVASALARGRAATLQLMVDRCLVERKTGRTFNSATGEYTDVWTEVYPTGGDVGACRIKPQPQSNGQDVDFAEHEATLRRYTVSLPWDATPEIRREDRFTVTASEDEWLIGRHLEVVAIGLSGSSTARRIAVEDRS